MDDTTTRFVPPSGAPRSIIETMPVGYIALGPDWRITRLNAAAESILSVRESDVLGQDLWTRFPRARDLVRTTLDEVMATRQSASVEMYYPPRSRWFELRVQPGDDGGVAIYSLDVSERRRAEARLAEAATRAQMIAAVSAELASHLDVREQIARLARLVVPYLGTWSMVSVVDDVDGTGTTFEVVDLASWHVSPELRGIAYAYARLRGGSLRYESPVARVVRTSQPIIVEADATAVIRERLVPGPARDALEKLAPEASYVLPMIARGHPVGALTVWADAAWTAEQHAAARDIVARAALAIDNAQAYARVEASRRQAEIANERLALLGQVGELLAGVDREEAIGRLARLAVPALADWCVVAIADDAGTLHNLGWAHRDPARADEVAAYVTAYSRGLTDESAARTVLRTGEPVILPVIDADHLVTAIEDPETQAMAASLDPAAGAVYPLVARGRAFGVLTLVTTSARPAYSPEELVTAAEFARRAAVALDATRSADRANRLIESMQRSILSVPTPAPGLRVATRYLAADVERQVGGDWYDAFSLPSGSTVLTIGDVVGHDIGAIAAMAQLRTLMRASAWTLHHSPAEVLGATDEASRSLGPSTFATALVADLEPALANGSVPLRWSSAGHPPPIVLDPDGSVRVLRARPVDLPLGVTAGAPRRDHALNLVPGSVLLLYTDGLIERRDEGIEDGVTRLADAVERLYGRDLDALLDGVLAEVAGGSRLLDDVVVMALRVEAQTPTDARPASDEPGGGFVVQLPVGTIGAAVARHYVAQHGAHLPASVVGDAQLLVSELAGNAVRHGRPPITLRVRTAANSIWVGLTDSASALPRLPSAAPSIEQPSGRGLLIIDHYADEWGVETAPGFAGKTVWFRLDRPAR